MSAISPHRQSSKPTIEDAHARMRSMSLSSHDGGSPTMSPQRKNSFIPPIAGEGARNHSSVPFTLGRIEDDSIRQMEEAEKDMGVDEVRILLRKERQKNQSLIMEVQNLKERHMRQQSQAEMLEEERVLKMLARMKDLKNEKERIVNELEREEEMLVNTLQRKMKEGDRPLEGKGLDDN